MVWVWLASSGVLVAAIAFVGRVLFKSGYYLFILLVLGVWLWLSQRDLVLLLLYVYLASVGKVSFSVSFCPMSELLSLCELSPAAMHKTLFCSYHYLSMCLLLKRKWRVLCWNVRGLNSENRQSEIRAKIDESECDIVCFQETKCENFDWRLIRKFCPKRFDNFVFSPSVGASGGVVNSLELFCIF
jgi:hypothetical protein